MYEEINIVLLPTSEKGNFRGRNKFYPSDICSYENKLYDSKSTAYNPLHTTFMHVYVTSNDTIGNNEYFICDNKIFQLKHSDGDYSWYDPNICKKIVATTDKSITINKIVVDSISSGIKQVEPPKPNPEFISELIENYNNHLDVSTALLEYVKFDNFSFAKINPETNTVNLKSIKQTFNKSEIVDIFNKLITNNFITPENVEKCLHLLRQETWIDYDKEIEKVNSKNK